MSTAREQMPKNLLAKSERFDRHGRLEPGCLLVQHTLDVVNAAKTIIETVGPDLQRFFKLTDDQMPSLAATSVLAAFCHDIGKANDGFQAMITKRRRDQAIRHEHLSTLVMSLPEVKAWLQNIAQADYGLARLIVLGHHLKTDSDDNIATRGKRIPVFALSLNGDEDFMVYGDPVSFPEFKQVLESLCLIEDSVPKPTFTVPNRWSFFNRTADICLEEWREEIIDELVELVTRLKKQDARLRLLWAARTVFFAADAVASGLRRTDTQAETDELPLSIGEWIMKSLKRGKSSQAIGTLIEKRKAEFVRRQKAKGKNISEFTENDFQKEMWKLGSRALLLAPCGSGKTLAAYLWIKQQLQNRPGWKVVFLYPTTGTATEGFKDYASHDEESALVHSRAAFDLEGMFKNPDDERSNNNYSVDQRLYALGYWPDAIFSATADAFLSFLQNNYSSLCLLPVLARSVIVIDEIHSFDFAMFDALLEFLQNFDAPVLLMTASLQKQRREKLERAIPEMTIYPQPGDMKRLRKLQKSADFPRYRVQYQGDRWKGNDTYQRGDVLLCPRSLLDLAREARRGRLRILWVVNTVDRCIRIAKDLESDETLCYHSRFMYEDRLGRHRAVINQFQDAGDKGVIAVTTQVCEMSLDLDADLLVTELAPASSLIQRMGRCNRSIEGRDPEEHGRVFIYDPPDSNPYEEEAVQTGRDLIAAISVAATVRQSELASTLETISEAKEPGKRCLFTMAMWESYSGNDFRDTDEFTVSALLESRLKDFQNLRRKRDSKSAGLILQAPRKWCETERRSDVWLPIVPDVKEARRIEYDATYGLREK
jgi:CRISPR-associated endonuclease/helicase Cas3